MAKKEFPRQLHWTRAGAVEAGWGAYDSFESLVFSKNEREWLQKKALGFLGAQDFCAQARLAWRRGLLFFGPSGVGKTSASRALALLLGWTHVTLPASELCSTADLARALSESVKLAPAVVVFEDLDRTCKQLDPAEFLSLYDSFSERNDGLLWVATTQSPEELPKSQLIRPGRFDEAVRLSPPLAETKREFFETYLAPLMGELDTATKQELQAVLESDTAMTFAHLNEMRLLLARVAMDGESGNMPTALKSFSQEQHLGGDRFGAPNATALALEERVKLADPRLLLSGLQVTDAFKRVVEMTLSNASEALVMAQNPAESLRKTG